MPSVSAAQHRLMEAAAHTKGGYGGVSQAVGREFVAKDSDMTAGLRGVKLDAACAKFDRLGERLDAMERRDAECRVADRARYDGADPLNWDEEKYGPMPGWVKKENERRKAS